MHKTESSNSIYALGKGSGEKSLAPEGPGTFLPLFNMKHTAHETGICRNQHNSSNLDFRISKQLG
jgi:hypothetical protein